MDVINVCRLCHCDCCDGHDAPNLVNAHYCTLSHITAHTTIIEPVVLVELWITKRLARAFKAHLWDTYGKGGNIHLVHQNDHIHPLEFACASGWRYWDHPVWILQQLQHRHPSLQPRPHQHWLKQRGWRLLPNVLCAFLSTKLVQLPLKCNKEQSVTVVITHNYTIYYIITLAIIIMYYYKNHCYWLLQHYYIISYHYYIIIISFFHYYYYVLLRSLLLHCYYTIITNYYIGYYCILFQIQYYDIIIMSLLYLYYVFIMSFLHHYNKWEIR